MNLRRFAKHYFVARANSYNYVFVCMYMCVPDTVSCMNIYNPLSLNYSELILQKTEWMQIINRRCHKFVKTLKPNTDFVTTVPIVSRAYFGLHDSNWASLVTKGISDSIYNQ